MSRANNTEFKQCGKCKAIKSLESFGTVRGKIRSFGRMELSIDHCHTTGKVRGLLCRQCNIALGKFKEDVTILQSAIAYLKKYE